MINPSLLTSERPLKLKVAKIEAGFAKLVLSDNQSIQVSRKYLPKGATEGDVLFLNLLTGENLELSRREVAKMVLEEILSRG